MDNLDNADPREKNLYTGQPPDDLADTKSGQSSLEPLPETPNSDYESPLELGAEYNQLANDQLNSSTMEVHHHGHVHEKKKWKEYVFQFFMLFLAVFCGFLAEYQLEHMIEHNREKQFMVSLIKDLESDTAQLNNIKRIRIRYTTRIDSAISFLVTQKGSSVPLRQLANLNLGLRSFYQNSGTLDQLKNAGGLRLIRKRNVVDSISVYDQYVKRMVLRDKFETDRIYDYSALSDKIFDGKMLAKIYADTTYFQKPAPSLETPINFKTEYLGELLSALIDCRASYQGNLNLQESIKRKAERLISLIRREYSISDQIN